METGIDVKTIIRLGLVCISVGYAIMARLISDEIGNRTLKNLAFRTTVFFIAMFMMSVIGAWFDYALGYEIGIFTTVVEYAFRGYVLYVMVKIYLKLKEPQVEISISSGDFVVNPEYVDKTRISSSLDTMFNELRVNIDRTEKIEQALINMR